MSAYEMVQQPSRGLERGMGFILWLKEGYVDCLEGYSYDESTTGIAFELAAFEVLQE